MANNLFKNIKDSVEGVVDSTLEISKNVIDTSVDITKDAYKGTENFVKEKSTEIAEKNYQRDKTKTIEGLKSTYSLSDTFDQFLDDVYEGLFNCEETYIDKDQILKDFYPQISRKNKISDLSQSDYDSLLSTYKLNYINDSLLASNNLLSSIKCVETLIPILKLENMGVKDKFEFLRNILLLIGALYKVEPCVSLVRVLNYEHTNVSVLLLGKKMDDVISDVLDDVLDKEYNQIQSQSCLEFASEYIDEFSFSYDDVTSEEYLNDIDTINAYYRNTNNQNMIVQSSTYELDGQSLPLQIINKGQVALSKIVDSDITLALKEYAPDAAHLASVGQFMVNATSNDLYKVVIPKGAKLIKSAAMPGASRGIIQGAGGKIAGHANLVKAGPMASASAPLMLANLAQTAMIKQEFKKLNQKVDKMSKTLNDVKLELVNKQKGEITSIVKETSDIKNHLDEILKSEQQRKTKITRVETLEGMTTTILEKIVYDIEVVLNKKDIKDVNEYQECVDKLEYCVYSQEMLLETLNQLSILSFFLYQGERSEDSCFSKYNRSIETRNSLAKMIYLWHIKEVDVLKIDTLSGKVGKSGVSKLLGKNGIEENLLTTIQSQVQIYPKIKQDIYGEQAIYLDGQGNYFISDEN